ncbi:DUF5723 family protein [Rubrolithibacter danxiaensis]|uniref:DUF5723 family protein n=1 Tax=Rubrolithibacter danxiaensis TaxID=3390805 RepID=UPI003BF8249C
MKLRLLLLILLINSTYSFAQQFSLYNTNTLFDGFENPSQKTAKADTTRQYAFNFLIPATGFNAAFLGPAQPAVKNILAQGSVKGSNLTVGDNELNNLYISSNNYLAMFKIFKTVRLNKEIGFAWQVRTDNKADITTETLAIFDNYGPFRKQAYYENAFNNIINNQSYHQLSFTYRQDIDKKTGFGVKLSYLSGITYNKLEVDSSMLSVNKDADYYILRLQGSLKSNYQYKEIDPGIKLPGFKNPGLAFTLSGYHKFRNGVFVMGNIKDLGIIKWSKKSYYYSFDNSLDSVRIDNASRQDAGKRLGKGIDTLIMKHAAQKGFVSAINGKAELLVTREFGNYKPSLLLSKSLFYPGSDIALMNSFRIKAFNFSLSTTYNTTGLWQVGGMGMIQTPDFEFYIGSDQFLRSYYTGKGIITSDNNLGNGNSSGASFYMGFAVKFGRVVEHNANASSIPGVGRNEERPGIFSRLFKKNK